MRSAKETQCYAFSFAARRGVSLRAVGAESFRFFSFVVEVLLSPFCGAVGRFRFFRASSSTSSAACSPGSCASSWAHPKPGEISSARMITKAALSISAAEMCRDPEEAAEEPSLSWSLRTESQSALYSLCVYLILGIFRMRPRVSLACALLACSCLNSSWLLFSMATAHVYSSSEKNGKSAGKAAERTRLAVASPTPRRHFNSSSAPTSKPATRLAVLFLRFWC